MMTIILTGGAGFSGSNFVYHMLDAHSDYRIVCIDKLTYAGNLSTLAPLLDEKNPDYDTAKAARFRLSVVIGEKHFLSFPKLYIKWY